LAFALEMLGIHDEALVQYDELDAMFTQFILNSQVGSKHFLFDSILLTLFINIIFSFFRCPSMAN